MNIEYNKLFTSKRFLLESTNTNIENAFVSDKSRVIFSSPFRRLQQKTQVFGLEKNAGVRSRLTHTLEVANTGSLIAKKVVEGLIKKSEINEKYGRCFVDITETCCLLHDIGNPPFGHFGEAAIQKWFEDNWQGCFDKSTVSLEAKKNDLLKDTLINDFIYFDGNPQGIRIILHLKNLPMQDYEYGFNLTYSQILACLKYVAMPRDVKSKPEKHKKAGYFYSEKNEIDTIRKELNWDVRFPITYIMEAADDISYCLSDIEDGIEKGIIDTQDFFKELGKLWPNPDLDKFQLKNISGKERNKITDFNSPEDFYHFKIRLTRSLINIASELYLSSTKSIMEGTCGDLLKNDEDCKQVLDALKKFAKKHLFRSKEAEHIELAGYKVIFGLLESFKELLILPNKKIELLVKAKDDISVLKGEKLDVQLRLFNMLSPKQKDAYSLAINKIKEDLSYTELEWYYRAHLIVDFISGMTDTFALETYRLLNGITIHNHG